MFCAVGGEAVASALVLRLFDSPNVNLVKLGGKGISASDVWADIPLVFHLKSATFTRYLVKKMVFCD